MTPERYARLTELFDRACDLSPDGQRALLESIPSDDEDLVEPLRAMLEQDARDRVFVDVTHGAGAVLARDILRSALAEDSAPPIDAADPAEIGDYRILERIGAGAMGTVYRARQREPERVVALKVLHPWLLSPRAVERFRFEAQALAALRHPGIPPIYAVGQHQRAVYLAMELVTGPTLMEWMRAKRPTLRARVEMIARVCDAVHHANLRGFVHRDLKPDNVRVGEDGSPRVLDFGVSSTIGAAREIAGTIAYMSPEQFDPTAALDVRADVYALGSTAFQLFSGELPIALDAKVTLDDARAAKRAGARRAASVDPGLRGDLDAILARALAARPDDRYASAAELGAELRRHLEHLPVLARGGGVSYRAGRWWRRNRVLGAALATVLALLVGGVAVSTWQYHAAAAARTAETRQRRAAESEAARARATVDFVTSLLAEANPETGRGREPTVRTALERAAARLGSGALTAQPAVEAAVRVTLARTYMGLGDWSEAGRHIDVALAVHERSGLDDDELLPQALLLAAQIHHEAGQREPALAAGARAIAAERALHPELHSHVAYAVHVHAVSSREAGRFAAALALHREAIAIYRAVVERGAPDGDLTDALNQMAVTLAFLGRYDESEPLYREALERDIARLGDEHPEVATDLHHIAWLEQERGNPHAALEQLARALAIREQALGADHSRVGVQRVLEADAYLSLGRLDEADRAMQQALAISLRDFGPDHPRTTRAELLNVRLLVELGRIDEAVRLAERLVSTHEARFGADHWVSATTHAELAGALLAAGRSPAACRHLASALGTLDAQLGPAARPTRLARAIHERASCN